MSKFFALMGRMKYINRWSLMRNIRQENIAEHSHQVAMIAHALAVIENGIFHRPVNADRVGMIALYHEASEVLTGDLPTPIKYFNQQISKTYKEIEAASEDRLLNMLDDPLRGEIRWLVQPGKDSFEYKLVKYADKIAAYIKCIEEMESGNSDFADAKATITTDLYAIECESVQYFLEHYIDAYFRTLDEIN